LAELPEIMHGKQQHALQVSPGDAQQPKRAPLKSVDRDMIVGLKV
jgi:hypothetical protein